MDADSRNRRAVVVQVGRHGVGHRGISTVVAVIILVEGESSRYREGRNFRIFNGEVTIRGNLAIMLVCHRHIHHILGAAIVGRTLGDHCGSVVNGGGTRPSIMVSRGTAIGHHAHRITALVRAEVGGGHRKDDSQFFGFVNRDIHRILITEQIGDDDTMITKLKSCEGVGLVGGHRRIAVD